MSRMTLLLPFNEGKTRSAYKVTPPFQYLLLLASSTDICRKKCYWDFYSIASKKKKKSATTVVFFFTRVYHFLHTPLLVKT